MTPDRRSKGDGGLVQRHDHATCPPLVDGERAGHRCQGRWVGTIDTVVDGRKRRKYVYAKTQRAARLKLTEAVRARDAGTLVIGTVTVGAWLTAWLKKQRRLKPQTLRGYRSKVDRYLIPHLGHHRLTALRPVHIEAMYDALRDQGLAEATVRQTHAILGKALSDATRLGTLGVNPMVRVEAPGTEKNKRAHLDLAQARAVLAAAADSARWWLALFYGMRQGECLGLRWCDVDLDRHTLTIAQTLQTAEDGSLIFDRPKSSASARVLPLHPIMEARLRLAWATQDKLHRQPLTRQSRSGSEPSDPPLVDHSERAGCTTGGASDTLVFARPDGNPIRPRDDWQAWRDLLAAAGVPPVALHSARQSAANLMEEAGLPDRLVAQILGHSQVQITHGYQTADLARMLAGLDAAGLLLEDGRGVRAPELA